MEKLSTRVADLLLKKHHIEKSKYSIYKYGMQMALEIICSLLSSIIICYLCGMIKEGIIFFLIFIPLRSYLGGIHMKSYWACWTCSCVTLIIVLSLVEYVALSVFLSWIILSLSIIVILWEAKSESEKSEEGAYFFKKIRIIFCFIIAMSIIFSVLGDFKVIFLIACTNVLIAVSKILENRYTTNK